MGHLAIQKLLDSAIEAQIGSGAAGSWGSLRELRSGNFGTPVFSGKTSHFSTADAVRAETIFDLASLTKILATTALYMILDETGVIPVEALVSDYFAVFVKEYPQFIGVSFKHLLSHTSGLPAWKPFYETLFLKHGPELPFLSLRERKSAFYELVLKVPREQEPGVRVVYSDLGYLILSHLAEIHFQKSFDQIIREQVWSRIPGVTFHFRPVVSSALSERLRIALSGESVSMTEQCQWRGLLQGQVHDDNSWSMGGISGHAGVFGTLKDVQLWVQALMSEKIAGQQTMRKFFYEVTPPEHSRRAIGFDLAATDGNGTTGFAFSPFTVGHLGYTGTSVWIDLVKGVYAILLTNRVHPSRADTRIRELRRAFHQECASRELK